MATPFNDTESDDLANALFENLTSDVDFELPKVDLDDPIYQLGNTDNNPLYSSVKPITLDELTTRKICGDGVFDALMDSYSKHIQVEYEKGRITGTEYAQAYVQLTSNAMSQAVQFLMQKDQAYWSALLVQAQGKAAEIAAIQALVDLQRMKVELATATVGAEKMKADYALTKLQLSSEDARLDLVRTQDDIEEFRLANILPLEVTSIQDDLITKGIQRQILSVDHQKAQYEFSTLMPDQHELNLAQIAHTEKQGEMVDAQISVIEYDLQNIKPAELLNMEAQRLNIESQTSKVDYEVNTLLPDQHSLNAQLIIKSEKEVELIDFDINSIKPVELLHLTAQTAVVNAQGDKLAYELSTLMPDEHSYNLKRLDLADNEILKTEKDIEMQEYQIEYMLPAQLNMTTAQISQITAQNQKISAERDNVIYQTNFLNVSQRENIMADTEVKEYQSQHLMPAQVLGIESDNLMKEYQRTQILPIQRSFTQEQLEAKRAETMDSRTDGISVTGSIGKQKQLYDQQIDSYKRDAEYKIGRMMIDTWITQKGIDEGLSAPTQLQNPSIDSVIQRLKTNNELT